MKRWIAVAAMVAGVGCSARLTYTPPEKVAPPDYAVVIDKPFDEAWADLIEFVSKTFFSINNLEKDSGLITLDFGTSTPEEYVDCGHFTEDTGIPFDGPYVRYLAKPLTGRVNVFVRKTDVDHTKVQVYARYALNDWYFDTGSPKTRSLVIGLRGETPVLQDRTCRSNYVIEKTILEGISGRNGGGR